MRSAPGVIYAAAMTAGAGVVGLLSRVPGAPARWRGWRDRLTPAPAGRGTAGAVPALWVHAASVGEVRAVRPLLAPLRERFPGRQLVVSTTTRTGLEIARTFSEAHATTLLPLDAPPIIRRLVDGYRLDAFLFTETEIWPNLLVALQAQEVPAIMVSGRVTDRTVRRARWVGRLYPEALAQVTCCMQTETDAERIVRLGAEPRRVHVTGSLKEAGGDEALPVQVAALGEALAETPRRLIVAGSTHPGEDERLLAAYMALLPGRPDVLLALAPRHPDQVARVAGLIAEAGLPVERLSRFGPTGQRTLAPGARVILLDAMGLLTSTYQLATVAFVGGTLVPVGGHNVLEPARAGRPIVVGPHTDNAQATVDRLRQGGALTVVDDAQTLGLSLATLLDDASQASAMGARARALIADGQGTIDRHMKIIATRVSTRTFAQRRDERA